MFFALFVLFITGTVSTVHSSAATPRPQMRIINGTTTTIRKYPFIASLQSTAFCGCSFVNQKWLLTAAHCVFGIPANAISVRYGSTDMRGRYAAKLWRYIIHPSYPFSKPQHDIALLELDKPVIFDYITIAAINLPVMNFELPQNPHERKAVIVGWGKNHDHGQIQQKLQESELEVYSDGICQRIFMGHSFHDLCAFVPGGGKGVCSGDSGGPLVYKGNILIGIIARNVIPMGSAPSIFTKVSHYIDWIRMYTK